MDTYGPPEALYYITDGLMCITYLVGIIAGVIALTRKKILLGVLAIIASLSFILELAVYLIIWSVLGNVIYDYTALNWAEFCIRTPLILVGAITLVMIVFTAIGKKEILPPPQGSEETPPNALEK